MASMASSRTAEIIVLAQALEHTLPWESFYSRPHQWTLLSYQDATVHALPLGIYFYPEQSVLVDKIKQLLQGSPDQGLTVHE